MGFHSHGGILNWMVHSGCCHGKSHYMMDDFRVSFGLYGDSSVILQGLNHLFINSWLF